MKTMIPIAMGISMMARILMAGDVDVALAIEKLVPHAVYYGSVTANTKQAYDNIRWKDKRAKPTWEQILKANELVKKELAEQKVKEELEAKVEEEMRIMAIERLKKKGVITPSEAEALKKK